MMDEKMNYLFKRVCDEYEGAKLGKKATQKIFYFFERQGIALNLRYGIHYYGPYSQRLSDYIDELETEGFISIAEEQRTHVISWNMNVSSVPKISGDEEHIIDKVLDALRKKTPVELEALSTIDYISHYLLKDEGTDDQVLNRFMDAKGKKFSNEEAKKYMEEWKVLF